VFGMTSVTAGESGGFAWAAATDVGRLRAENQDAWLVQPTPRGLLFAVADGMGGHPNGAWAARFACQGLLDDLVTAGLDAPSSLATVVAELNRRLRSEAEALGTPGAGTTLTAALVDGRELRWVHVGDSRLYRFDGEALHRVTTDHNLAAEPGGHPRLANVLTRCLGMAGDLEPDAGVDEVPRGLLLATDGLYQQVSPEALRDAFDAADLARAARDLVDLANATGGPDNITVIIARATG
jgi:serine/threonine protein phosphatase PrpC